MAMSSPMGYAVTQQPLTQLVGRPRPVEKFNGSEIGKKSIDVTSGRIGYSEMNKARGKLLKIRSVENMRCILGSRLFPKIG